MNDDAVWRRFDRVKFVLYVQSCLDASTKVREGIHLVKALTLKGDRAALSPFFGKAKLPRWPSGKVYFEVILALFRSHYHWLRHILVALTSADRRAAWKYVPLEFHGDGDEANNWIDPPKNWRPYTSAFYHILDDACNLIFILIVPEVVCARASADPLAVEALAWKMTCNPAVAEILVDSASPSHIYQHRREMVNRFFESFNPGLVHLGMLFLRNRTAYPLGMQEKAHTLNLVDNLATIAGPAILAYQLERDIDPDLERKDPLQNLSTALRKPSCRSLNRIPALRKQ